MSEQADRTASLTGVGLGVAAVLCCGFPLLIGSGALAAMAGIGLGFRIRRPA